MYFMFKRNMLIAAILLCSSQMSAAQIFECKDRMCNFQNYDEISEEEMVKVEIIWK